MIVTLTTGRMISSRTNSLSAEVSVSNTDYWEDIDQSSDSNTDYWEDDIVQD